MTEAEPQPPNLATELALLVALATLWGASYTFIRIGVATIPPITLIAGRTAIAGLLLLVIMRARGVKMPTDAATWRRFLFQAGLNSVIPWTMVAWGERTVDAGLATILNSTAPIFTFFLTLLVTRHEAVTSRKLIGVVAGMVGICLIVGVQALAGFGEQLTAQIVTLLATVCYAGAAIFGRGFKGLDPMAPAAGSLMCGAAILIPLSLVFEQPWTLTPSTEFVAGAARAGGVLDRVRLRDLFPPDPDAGLGRHHRAGLSAGADRRRARRRVPRRASERDGMDRACLRRHRRRRDDDPGAEGHSTRIELILPRRHGAVAARFRVARNARPCCTRRLPASCPQIRRA